MHWCGDPWHDLPLALLQVLSHFSIFLIAIVPWLFNKLFGRSS
jgi:hypothetical protein